MRLSRFLLAATVVWGGVGGYIALAQKRADYWGAILSRNLVTAGSPGLERVRSLPFKGCGWSLGETVWGWTEMAGTRTKVLMCRSRDGVRIDITNFESRWIRGPAAPVPSRETPND